jgi:broad specificity phosphatase PhoE
LASKKIYLIRHGQTDYNLKGYVQGSGVDSDLNELGRKQAALFFEHYKDLPFKKVYTSVLKRSIQSVQGFIELGIPHEASEALNEINWGNTDGKTVAFSENTDYIDLIRRWQAGQVDFKPPGGESPLEVQNKQKKMIDIILGKKEEDIILICMHGRAIRILLSTLLQKDLKNMDQFEHQNLGLYLLHYDEIGFSIEKRNNVQHLF